MESRKRAFKPAMEGRLEDRIVLNGGGAPSGLVPSQVHPHPPAPRQAILTTRQYSLVLVGIHQATDQLGRSRGGPAAYARAAGQIARQLGDVPFARQEGLVNRVVNALPSYGPHQARELYADIRQTLIVYLSHEVDEGRLLVRSTPSRFFSDADLVGDGARINNPENGTLYDTYITGSGALVDNNP